MTDTVHWIQIGHQKFITQHHLLFLPMRYLILFFAFLSPITLLAQSEGTIEYSATTEMKMDMETIMANMPEEMLADSAMVAQMAQSFENMGNQQQTVTMLLHFSGSQGLLEVVMPDLPNPLPNVSPFGSFDNNLGITSYFDYDEQKSITKNAQYRRERALCGVERNAKV